MDSRKYVLCEDGFENRIEDGQITGFNVKMRIPYYRGVPLSLIKDLLVVIDGVEYGRDKLRFHVGGLCFTPDEMKTVVRHRWEFGEKATVEVLKPGGLAPGKHRVEAYAALRITYMPRAELTGGWADLELA